MKKRFADSLDWTDESTDCEVFHWYWKIYLSRFSSTIFFFLERCSLPLTNSGHNMSSYMFMSLFNMILCGVCIILIIAVQFLLSEVSAKDLENPLFVSATVLPCFRLNIEINSNKRSSLNHWQDQLSNLTSAKSHVDVRCRTLKYLRRNFHSPEDKIMCIAIVVFLDGCESVLFLQLSS